MEVLARNGYFLAKTRRLISLLARAETWTAERKFAGSEMLEHEIVVLPKINQLRPGRIKKVIPRKTDRYYGLPLSARTDVRRVSTSAILEML
jgi:hypothetical protein